MVCTSCCPFHTDNRQHERIDGDTNAISVFFVLARYSAQPVPKADPINDPHEKRIREFVENVFKGVVKLPEKGTICVTKWRYATVALVWKTREELEHWNLRYHIDSIDNEDLGAQLTAMMEGLTSESLEDLQNGASDEQAEFDITFVQ